MMILYNYGLDLAMLLHTKDKYFRRSMKPMMIIMQTFQNRFFNDVLAIFGRNELFFMLFEML